MAWDAEDLMFDPSSVSGNGSMRTPVRGSDGTDLGTQPKYAPGGGPWLGVGREAAPTTQGIAQQQTRPLNQPPMQQQRGPGDPPGVSITMDPAAPNGGDIWARVMQAAKAGLISKEQQDAIAKKLGYGQQQQQPDIAGNGKDVASNLGATVGGIVGGAGRAIYDKVNAPAGPGAPLDISGGGVNPPSPAWNN